MIHLIVGQNPTTIIQFDAGQNPTTTIHLNVGQNPTTIIQFDAGQNPTTTIHLNVGQNPTTIIQFDAGQNPTLYAQDFDPHHGYAIRILYCGSKSYVGQNPTQQLRLIGTKCL